MFSIRNLDHLVLRVDQLDAVQRFYIEVLGCELERHLPELGLLQLRAGTSLIDLVPIGSELGRAGGDAPDMQAPNLEHFCLLLDGIDEQGLLDHLANHGVAVEPFQERYGATGFGPSIYISDPMGNRVELKLATTANS